MLNQVQARFLTDANPAIVTTLRADGSPNSTMVWADWDGEYVIVNTVVGRLKERQLRRDNRISVCVIDRNNPIWYLGVDGHAELTTEGAHEHVNTLALRHQGKEFVYKQGAVRIIARFRPERVWGIWDAAAEQELKAGRDWEQHRVTSE